MKGTKKTCPGCGGRGRINYRYERIWVYDEYSLVPTTGRYDQKEISDECSVCKGKGHLELKGE